MSNVVDISKSSEGTDHENTLVGPMPMRFVIVEVLGASDTNALRKRWLSYGYQDVSPLWGNEKSVKSFAKSKKNIKRWSEFHADLAAVEAEWICLSGHHGRQFGNDGAMLDEGNSPEIKETGFFNDSYYHGRWSFASRFDDPFAEQNLLDVYLSTSNTEESFLRTWEKNPLYEKIHLECKGVIFWGCNTLFYRCSRMAYYKYFPNAVIIGMIDTTAGGLKAAKPVLKICDNRFFSNPPTDNSALANFCEELARSYYKPQGIGIQYQDRFWLYGSDKQVRMRKVDESQAWE